MDKKEFKKLVRPYITRGAYLNKELILQDFESKINGERHIIIENKLIYIPIEERPWTEKETNEATGTFVYSENSKMYCWASGFKKIYRFLV